MNDIYNKILDVVADHFGLDKVHEGDDLVRDLNADPLDVIELVMRLEEEFNITITDGEAESLVLVQDACACVNEKITGAGANPLLDFG